MSFKEKIMIKVKKELESIDNINFDDIFIFYKHNIRIDLNKLAFLDELCNSNLCKNVKKECWHLEKNIWGFYENNK